MVIIWYTKRQLYDLYMTLLVNLNAVHSQFLGRYSLSLVH